MICSETGMTSTATQAASNHSSTRWYRSRKAFIGAGFLAGLEHRLLQVRRQLLERLAGEADRPDGDGVLGHREVRAHHVELHRLDAGRLVLAGADHPVLDRVVDLV